MRMLNAFVTTICLWLLVSVVSVGWSKAGQEPVVIPSFARHFRSTQLCLDTSLKPRPETYRVRGLMWAIERPMARAYYEYDTHRIVFVQWPPPIDVVRHESIHALLSERGHPDWAFDKCVEPMESP